MELERACPSAAHWTEGQYQLAVRPGSEDPERLVLVAEASPPAAGQVGRGSAASIVGFLVARHLAPEWELENVVVDTTARRRGLGTELLEALLAAARQTGSQSVFLEVRESNLSARKLYEKMHFEQSGRRKAYYSNPGEDAILYRLRLRSQGT